MSEENPPTDEIDDAWLKRREDWCAANVNKHNAAGYTAEMMFAMCARIRADKIEIERANANADGFEDELSRMHDQIWQILKTMGVNPKPMPHHDLTHCLEQIDARIRADGKRIERLEKAINEAVNGMTYRMDAHDTHELIAELRAALEDKTK